MDNFFNIATTPILIKDVSNIVDTTLIEKEFDKLDFTKNQENSISSNLNFFDISCLLPTKDLLSLEAENFLRFGLQVENFSSLTITKSWGNITQQGEMHHSHVHPFSVVSGVLYLDDNPANLDLHLEQYYPTVPYYYFNDNKEFVSLQDVVGDSSSLKNHIVLFLSNTRHFVKNNTNNSPRRSIAFNTFWKGLTGRIDQPLSQISF